MTDKEFIKWLGEYLEGFTPEHHKDNFNLYGPYHLVVSTIKNQLKNLKNGKDL